MLDYLVVERRCQTSGRAWEVRKAAPDDLMFVTERTGHQLQTQDIRKLVRRITKKAKIELRVWPHLFRHSLATNMLNRGANIFSIQAILGHAYVSTTMDCYLHHNSRNVKADYHKCVPSML